MIPEVDRCHVCDAPGAWSLRDGSFACEEHKPQPETIFEIWARELALAHRQLEVIRINCAKGDEVTLPMIDNLAASAGYSLAKVLDQLRTVAA